MLSYAPEPQPDCTSSILEKGTIHMRKTFRVLGGSLVVTVLLVMSLVQVVGVSAASRQNATLPSIPHSPVSPSTLIAAALQTGKIHINSGSSGQFSAGPLLTCSPVPCALPNVQASGGNGTNISNEN